MAPGQSWCCHGDDAALGTALPHVAHGRLRGHEHGAHIHVQRVVKVGQRKTAPLTRNRHTGTVDEDVEAAQRARGMVHRVCEGRDVHTVRKPSAWDSMLFCLISDIPQMHSLHPPFGLSLPVLSSVEGSTLSMHAASLGFDGLHPNGCRGV